jgi:poly[(R)-3-hydroxyalkanoate] polymerase subunit PhaC
MSASAAFDLESMPERIQSEIQRAIQRSIKGVEYFSSSGPALGSTPKDVLSVRGTLRLYHYRPLADEIYRVPILIVMATTNRGYILDLIPGQSLIQFLLKRGYDVYMLEWAPPKPEEKSLRPESGAQRLAWARLNKSRFVARASAAVVELAKFRAGLDRQPNSKP